MDSLLLLPVRFLLWFAVSDLVRRGLLWGCDCRGEGRVESRGGEGRERGERMGGQWVEEGMPPSNLQCFLDCTTPTVETHILPKVTQPPPVK